MSGERIVATLRGIWNSMARSTRRILSLYHPTTLRERGWLWASGLMLVTLALALTILGSFWSRTPEQFDVVANAKLLQG